MQVLRAEISVLEKLPSANISNPEERNAFNFFVDPAQVLLRDQLDDPLVCARAIVTGDWGIALHWCFKMRYGLKNHKVPGAKYRVLFFKDLGAFIRSILELALLYDVYSSSSLGRQEFADPFQWFHGIIRELISADKQALTQKWSKREAIEAERKKIKVIRGGSLELEEEETIRHQMANETPLFLDLLETAKLFSSADSTGYFERRYMIGKGNPKDKYPHLGLLEAWGRWLATQDRPKKNQPKSGAMWVEDGKILMQSGQGRSVIQILPISSANSKKEKTSQPMSRTLI